MPRPSCPSRRRDTVDLISTTSATPHRTARSPAQWRDVSGHRQSPVLRRLEPQGHVHSRRTACFPHRVQRLRRRPSASAVPQDCRRRTATSAQQGPPSTPPHRTQRSQDPRRPAALGDLDHSIRRGVNRGDLSRHVAGIRRCWTRGTQSAFSRPEPTSAAAGVSATHSAHGGHQGYRPRSHTTPPTPIACDTIIRCPLYAGCR